MADIDQSVGAAVRKLENSYVFERTRISKYVEFSQYENIEKIDAYLNSKHISGEWDALGREKPFFNIVLGAVNIWYRATNVDRKDIRIRSTNDKDMLGAFLLNVHVQAWMKKSRFGAFLKDWGRSLARYGSSVVKFVEKDGMLIPSVIAWNRIISDVINFEDNIKIEILELTEAQLRQNKSYSKDAIDGLTNALRARTLINKERQDNRPDYIRLYEVHGMMSQAQYKMGLGQDVLEGDDETYFQQMQVISFVGTDKDGEFDDFVLYCGKEANDPYMITHLIKEDGRAQSIGAVESLFQAQWMNNHTQKQIKDQLDLASMIIFQSADANFVGQNALLAIQNGDILVHNGSPITQVENNSHDISSIQAWQEQWQNQAKEITSTPDAVSGETMPSGTAYRQVAILNQEANSLFEIMTENKGIHLEDMMREYVIPYILRTQMDNQDQIVATLNDNGIQQIEDTFVQNEAIARRKAAIKNALLHNGPITIPDQQFMEQQVRNELSTTGNERFISPDTVGEKTWKELFKDLDWTVEVEVTNEQGDTNAILTTLNTLFTNVISMGNTPMSPAAKFIFNKILDTTGVVSPLELAQMEMAVQNQQASQPAVKTPMETIDFKDLPPEGQAQMAAQAGIKLAPPAQTAPAASP